MFINYFTFQTGVQISGGWEANLEVFILPITKEVFHYVSRNIIAMLGTSIYVLIDTLFISIAAGALGLTALNLALPIFNLFNALGLLLGVGGATIFSLNKILHPERIESLYSSLMISAAILGIALAILIDIFSVGIVDFLGANNATEGAALAVIFSPAISLVVLSFHRKFKNRRLHFHFVRPSFKPLIESARLGSAAALNELSTGVSVFFFNHVLLMLANNYAVAAYGVISNIAIVVLAIANGVALGVQPVASREYGEHHFSNVSHALRVGIIITLALALTEFIILTTFKYPIIGLFNTQNSLQLVHYAAVGLPIYFTSAFFSALNYLFILFLTATNSARASFALSLLRGYLVLLPLIFILPFFFGLKGVWAAVPLTELIVTGIGIVLIHQRIIQYNDI